MKRYIIFGILMAIALMSTIPIIGVTQKEHYNYVYIPVGDDWYTSTLALRNPEMTFEKDGILYIWVYSPEYYQAFETLKEVRMNQP